MLVSCSARCPVVKLRFDIRQFADFDDPRDVPIYGIREAAHYLQVPPSTLRSWVAGRDYPVEKGRRKKRFQPLIELPDAKMLWLSFSNLAEAHVLSAFRREHNVPLPAIRAALEFVTKRYGWRRPFIEQEFKTDGVVLLIEELGRHGSIVDASAQGQLVMRKVVEAHLKRLEWENRLVSRLYPFTTARQLRGPKSVMMDPRYSFGRPILRNCHIPTAMIAERYKAGESVDDLADDYGCPRRDIEEALRCELSMKTAA